VQIVRVAPELYSFACRWYASLSSWVTVSLAPPFWFVVQFVLPVSVGEDAVGAGVGGALGDGLDGDDGDEDGDEDGGIGGGLGDELGDGVEDAPDRRLGRALGDGLADEDELDDEDGLGSGLDDEADPDCATQWSRIELAGHSGALTDTPVSFPDVRQA
jgi:hypothetical protein